MTPSELLVMPPFDFLVKFEHQRLLTGNEEASQVMNFVLEKGMVLYLGKTT